MVRGHGQGPVCRPHGRTNTRSVSGLQSRFRSRRQLIAAHTPARALSDTWASPFGRRDGRDLRRRLDGRHASYSRYSPRSPQARSRSRCPGRPGPGPDVPGHVRIVRITDRGQQVVRRWTIHSGATRTLSYRCARPFAIADVRISPRSRRRLTGGLTPGSSARRSRSTSSRPASESTAVRCTRPDLGARTLAGPGACGDGSGRCGHSHRPDPRDRRAVFSATSSSTRTWPRISPTTASTTFRDVTLHQSLLYPLLLAPAWFADSMNTTYGVAKGITAGAMALTAVPVYLWGRRLVPGLRPARRCADASPACLLLLGDSHALEAAFLPAFSWAHSRLLACSSVRRCSGS